MKYLQLAKPVLRAGTALPPVLAWGMFGRGSCEGWFRGGSNMAF